MYRPDKALFQILKISRKSKIGQTVAHQENRIKILKTGKTQIFFPIILRIKNVSQEKLPFSGREATKSFKSPPELKAKAAPSPM